MGGGLGPRERRSGRLARAPRGSRQDEPHLSDAVWRERLHGQPREELARGDEVLEGFAAGVTRLHVTRERRVRRGPGSLS